MKSRLGSLSFAMAVLIFGAARADADILAVEYGAPDVLRFTPGGVKTTFTATNLDGPIGINANAAGNVYVVNNGLDAVTPPTNTVAQYTSTGTPLGFFVTPATPAPPNPPPGNTLNAPVDIAFDGSGNAYVTNNGANYIAAYNSAGAFQFSFGTASTNLPSGIGYNPVNGLLYVVNSATTGTNANSFLIYNPTLVNTPTLPTVITPVGSGALDGGQQVAFDQNGNVFIASFGTVTGLSRVQEYSATGAYLRTIATTGLGAVGVAYDPTSNILYVAYQGNPPGGSSAGFIEKYAFNGVSFTDAGALATGLNVPQFLLNVPSAVPEPGSVVLMGLGVVAMAGYRLRRNRQAA